MKFDIVHLPVLSFDISSLNKMGFEQQPYNYNKNYLIYLNLSSVSFWLECLTTSRSQWPNQ